MPEISEKLKDETRAQILNDALPYIQKYYNKIVVVKYGGSAMTEDFLKQKVMSDIVLLSLVGIKIVLIHGGGPEINCMLERIGKKSEFIDGLRYTDKETAEIVQMVLCGKVNKNLVELLRLNNGEALGLCGLDGHMLEAVRLSPKLGYVGKIKKVNTRSIITALDNGYIPVIATVASGENGEVYNINADTAAAQIAAELHAANLILMTDTSGLLRDKDDESTLIYSLNVSDVPGLKSEGVLSGGMIPKIDCCVEAVRRGVKQANIIDGRIPHSILIELLTNEGAGTMIV